MKRSLSKPLLLLALAASLMLSACSQQPDSASSSSAAVPASSASASVASQPSSDTVEIVDMGGRTVTIPSPENLIRMYPEGSTSMILLYTLAPDKMTAAPSQTGSAFSDDQKPFVAPEVWDLPSYGTLSGKGSLNLEAIKAADVQVILSMGTSAITDADITTADELQAQLEIPVVLFSGDSED